MLFLQAPLEASHFPNDVGFVGDEHVMGRAW
jgi:hypothetical protein